MITKDSLNIIRLDTIDSTNNFAKALLKSGEPLPPCTVVYARRQTAGRGRLGREWYSTEGETLCMSLIIPHFSSAGITLLCALGVHEALSRVCTTTLSIKWPNDIVAGNKKLCGILTEGVGSSAVVGIGVNLNCASFPEDIAHKATSLKLITGNCFDAEKLCEEIALSVLSTFDTFGGVLSQQAVNKYTPLCINIGRKVSFPEGEGIATAVDNDGALVVKTAGEEKKITFGEVTVTDIY